MYQPDTPAFRQHLRGTRRSFLGATIGASAALLLSACRVAAPVAPTATPTAKVPPARCSFSCGPRARGFTHNRCRSSYREAR